MSVTYKEYREYLDSVYDEIRRDAYEALVRARVEEMVHELPSYARLVMQYYMEDKRITPSVVKLKLHEAGYSVNTKQCYVVLESVKRIVDGYAYDAKSDVTYYYQARDENGNVVPDYFPVSDGRDVGEFVTVGANYSGFRVTVWHQDFDYRSMADEIAYLFLEIADQQYLTSGVIMIYTGLDVDNVYRIVYRYMKRVVTYYEFLEIVSEYLKKNPLARKEVVIEYLKSRGIAVNLIWLSRAMKAFRVDNASLVTRAIDKVVKRILRENPHYTRKQVLKAISAMGMVVPKEFTHAFNAALSRYVVSREDFIRDIMSRLYRKHRKDIKSVTALVRLYRSRGYKGGNALLRRVAKEVMLKMGV